MSNKWIIAIRPRTLPLSSSGVILGIVLGFLYLLTKNPTYLHENLISIIASAIFILITAVLLQVLSNFANDFGDAKSGVDNPNRVGPKRGLVTGAMTLEELKKGIIVVTAITIFSGIIAVGLAFLKEPMLLISFLGIGLLAIIAAITYTVGIVYGYKGLGDISVFIFFGLVSVLGAQFMISKELTLESYLLASLSGFMSVMVLNVNNLRDFKSDILTGKNSLVVKMGLKGGKIYHLSLLILSLALILSLLIILSNLWASVLIILASILYVKSGVFCINPKNIDGVLDPMLKKTSIGACIINLTFSLIVLLLSFNIL